jgi:hypothetical protein
VRYSGRGLPETKRGGRSRVGGCPFRVIAWRFNYGTARGPLPRTAFGGMPALHGPDPAHGLPARRRFPPPRARCASRIATLSCRTLPRPCRAARRLATATSIARSPRPSAGRPDVSATTGMPLPVGHALGPRSRWPGHARGATGEPLVALFFRSDGVDVAPRRKLSSYVLNPICVCIEGYLLKSILQMRVFTIDKFHPDKESFH